MIAVIFEVSIDAGRENDYLRIATELMTELDHIDGFISVERFRSINNPTKLLSLSLWRDEDAVAAWRNQSDHRAAQTAGRNGIFRDYRLLIGEIRRDYGMTDRLQASVV